MPLLQREVKACTDLLLQRSELKRGTTERPGVQHSHGYRYGQGGQRVQQPLSPFLKGVISPYTKSPTTSWRGAPRRDSPPRSPPQSPTTPYTKSPTTRGGDGSARSSAARGGGGGGGGGHLPTAINVNLPAWATPRAERVSVLPRIDVESLLECDSVSGKTATCYDLFP